MPALGMAQETGKLVRWLRQDGEPVKKGDPLMEVETDKVTVEIESPASGILRGVRASDGDDVPVGQVVGWILATGESPADLPSSPATPAPSTLGSDRSDDPGRLKRAASPVAARMAAAHGIDLESVQPDGGRVGKADVLAFIQQGRKQIRAAGRKPLASPKARRLAAERQVALAGIPGSGPSGAVLAADVLQAAASFSGSLASAAMSPVWSRMVERLQLAWSQTPHFYLVREVNASQLMDWHHALQSAGGARPTISDLLLRLTGLALKQHPRMNAAWDEGHIRVRDEINLGLAVALDDGLVVPVVHQVDRMSVHEIAARRAELVERARNSRLLPEDVQGGTFTLSNLGMYGVDAFYAVVNPPQAAILAVGRIADRVVPVEGRPAVQPMMVISLSCDHRLVDGALAAKFLDLMAGLIEAPSQLLA
jgi:pyruvate dehydrogenase E2 component (dihydrolipoamide acetyltransferase)